ncbi:MAG: alpha/beta fold hydrolase [Cyanobacteria bacterium REEB65]|nr:alpha/beta fold hydrolase [Cyanobacteria bacterium REEB65]
MKPLGVLVLHGFTSSFDTVKGILPHLEAAGLPYRMPGLRGHQQSSPAALKGVKYRDWVDDAACALDDLLGEVDRAIVVGLSMGGLVALTLAVERPERLDGIVAVAAALRPKDPLAPLSPYLGWLFPRHQLPKPPEDEGYVCTNYPWFPGTAGAEVYKLGLLVESRLSSVKTPILVVGSERDHIIKPEASRIIYDRVRSPIKEIEMFRKTRHEMMQGCEKDDVFARIMAFIRDRRAAFASPSTP